MGLFKKKNKKYEVGMKKSREGVFSKIKTLFSGGAIDDDFFMELEEQLIMADLPVTTVLSFSESLQKKAKGMKDRNELKEHIINGLKDIYNKDDIQAPLKTNPTGPTVYLFVGVNGVGKTTTIAKVANKLKVEGASVLLAAGDTFRAGAIEQLNIWAERIKVDIVKKEEGSDPASVIFEAIKHAKANQYDYVLCDTAGRLQTKVNLMKELEKIKKVIQKELPESPEEVFLVLDATTGQNGLEQAKAFIEATDVTGVVLTKLDGTAKGGIVLAIREAYNIPIQFVGLGEQVDDLLEFDIDYYLEGMLSGLDD